MSEERHRVVLDPAYATALGEALYCFALCEWNAVYCIQKRQPGYVTDAFRPTQSTMAGTVADKLRSISRNLPDAPEKSEWEQTAQLFFDLVTTERNRLVHAKPGTNSAGDQRLFYFGYEWTIERVQELADRFTRCGMTLNDLFYRP
jgi:hypothetical protein